jgi:predicted dehydrogenase
MENNIHRRNFIKKGSAVLAASSIFPHVLFGKQEQKKVRIGFIGVGLRGRDHVRNTLLFPDVEINAICDIDPDAINQTQKMLREAGRKEAAVYKKNERDFENLVKRKDLDGVVISTPWEWHVPQALAAMKEGKYAGLEVPASVTLQESWDLVDTYEKTGSHCMILENACYRRNNMAILNMVRQNLFGEIIHLQCGYQHDLREVKFNNGKQPYGGGVEFGEKGYSEARWRTQHSVERNGDLYPTHGVGPMAQLININYGNQFLHLTSMATKSRGLNKFIVDHGGKNHPNAKVVFKLGDVVQTMIKCANGETILITHDTNLPRPYSLGYRVQGTNGIWIEEDSKIYFENVSPESHKWEPDTEYVSKFDHQMWKKYGDIALKTGHDGIDYFVMKEFIESVRDKTAPTMDVYDAAAWSAISALSEESIAKDSSSVPFPDFTRGKWKNRKMKFAYTQ